MVIFGSVRFDVSPEINATAAMILAVTLAVVVSYLVLRRSGQGREGTAMPGV